MPRRRWVRDRDVGSSIAKDGHEILGRLFDDYSGEGCWKAFAHRYDSDVGNSLVNESA